MNAASDRTERKISRFLLVVGFDLNLVLSADLDGQLQRVDRIEAQSLGEQRGVDVDLLRFDVLEHERLDDHGFQFLFDFAHGFVLVRASLTSDRPR